MSFHILLEVRIIVMYTYVFKKKFNKNLYIYLLTHIYILNIFIYIRELTSKDPRSELGYRLTVQVDQHDPARPLAVVHIPSLGSKVKQQVYIS